MKIEQKNIYYDNNNLPIKVIYVDNTYEEIRYFPKSCIC